MDVAIWAALAMVLQDIFAVVMCQMENRGKGWRAGCLDACSWLCALATNHYALNALNTHSFTLKATVVVLVTGANILGSVSGVKLGDHFFPDPNKCRLDALEAWAAEHGFDLTPRCKHLQKGSQ